ncbi:SLAM family member 5-like isoform X1 [Neoarius graeffei]|uniref:SLAM family member 5-like isoform X1 n=1 Tax=Neoarius graeffei TaxID=443677 RepID=UPI00298D333E|nr:SLAM family member 5-like isoform X1 [Neoarius graeffei]
MRRRFHHSLSLLFLFLSETFSSVGGSSVQEVIGAVGESFTFHTSVPVSGILIYKTNTVGQILNKYSDTNVSEKFVNRLHWDGQSGFFTLTDLRTDDSGLYIVESIKEPQGKQDYQLEVYERVSVPQVVNTSSSSSEFCLLLCSVRNVRGLKLFWSKENDVLLNYTSSSNSSDITLSLHLEIKMADIHTFSCVASNPVSNEATTINITHYCSLNSDVVSHQQRTVIVPVVVSVLLVVLVIVTYVYLRRKKLNGPYRRTEGRRNHDSVCDNRSLLPGLCTVIAAAATAEQNQPELKTDHQIIIRPKKR